MAALNIESKWLQESMLRWMKEQFKNHAKLENFNWDTVDENDDLTVLNFNFIFNKKHSF